jgi:hypothetical protein
MRLHSIGPFDGEDSMPYLATAGEPTQKQAVASLIGTSITSLGLTLTAGGGGVLEVGSSSLDSIDLVDSCDLVSADPAIAVSSWDTSSGMMDLGANVSGQQDSNASFTDVTTKLYKTAHQQLQLLHASAQSDDVDLIAPMPESEIEIDSHHLQALDDTNSNAGDAVHLASFDPALETPSLLQTTPPVNESERRQLVRDDGER